MKIVVRVLLVAVLAGLGFWLWTVFFPNPEKAIRKRLLEVSKEATFTANQNDIANGFAVNKILGYITPDAVIAMDIPNWRRVEFEGRDEIRLAAIAARRTFSVKVEFLDITPVVSADQKSAEVELVAKLSVAGERDILPQDLKILMKEVDGEWLISRVETVQVFNR
jgi:hypothetical protein